MSKINCTKCEHYDKRKECVYDFRWASCGGGQAVDNIRDVYRCLDYSETEDTDDYDEEDS